MLSPPSPVGGGMGLAGSKAEAGDAHGVLRAARNQITWPRVGFKPGGSGLRQNTIMGKQRAASPPPSPPAGWDNPGSLPITHLSDPTPK